MLDDLKVKVGPQFYQYHLGAIDFVPNLLDEYAAKNILVVHGTVSWEKAQAKLTFLTNPKYNVVFHQYTGECSYYGSELIVKLAKEAKIDFIIGVGGGKLTDLVGYASHLLNLNFGVIPTLASNCAPWTPLAVMYHENGEAEGKTEHFLRQAAFLITDPALVINSPVDYFIAGLADTLAKWYESDSILQQAHLKREPFLQLATYTSVLAKEEIMADSKKAIEDMKTGNLSAEFVRLSEIVFAVAGMVGGLGDKYARNAAAHAMHDGISKYIPASHRYLHGEKVAYGIFYQLALENQWQAIENLIPFYRDLGLPMSLSQMGIFPEKASVIKDIVKFIDGKDKVHLIPIEINEVVLENAIYQLEDYIKGNK